MCFTLLQVVDSLAFLHDSACVAHRDLKPGNIFMKKTPTDGVFSRIMASNAAQKQDIERMFGCAAHELMVPKVRANFFGSSWC